jgi:hypothetical protein
VFVTSASPPRRTTSTIPEQRVAVLVVVSPTDALLSACREAARYLPAASVQVTDVKSIATDVAFWRPFAIVIDEELFAFDPSEFIALARDVAAEILTAPESASRDELLTILLPRLKSTFQRWENAESSY